jgi:hypothetical protein
MVTRAHVCHTRALRHLLIIKHGESLISYAHLGKPGVSIRSSFGGVSVQIDR